jgi:hypothetical protein
MDNLGRVVLDTSLPTSGLVQPISEQRGLFLWRITTGTGLYFEGKLLAL